MKKKTVKKKQGNKLNENTGRLHTLFLLKNASRKKNDVAT